LAESLDPNRCVASPADHGAPTRIQRPGITGHLPAPWRHEKPVHDRAAIFCQKDLSGGQIKTLEFLIDVGACLLDIVHAFHSMDFVGLRKNLA
jgi:hypothetical protein